jgi:hypothetical protein
MGKYDLLNAKKNIRAKHELLRVQIPELRLLYTAGVLRSHPGFHTQLVHALVCFESVHCPLECGHHMLVHGREIIKRILQDIPCGLNADIDAILGWVGNTVTAECYTRAATTNQ